MFSLSYIPLKLMCYFSFQYYTMVKNKSKYASIKTHILIHLLMSVKCIVSL